MNMKYLSIDDGGRIQKCMIEYRIIYNSIIINSRLTYKEFEDIKGAIFDIYIVRLNQTLF
jgi:hypothetical protein